MELAERLKNAVYALSEALDAYCEAKIALHQTQREKDTSFTLGVHSGDVTGKNQVLREADHFQKHQDLYQAWEDAWVDAERAKLALDLCEYEWKFCTYLVRLEELNAARSP